MSVVILQCVEKLFDRNFRLFQNMAKSRTFHRAMSRDRNRRRRNIALGHRQSAEKQIATGRNEVIQAALSLQSGGSPNGAS